MTETTDLKAAVLDLQAGKEPNEYIIRATKIGAYANSGKGFQARWTEKSLPATAPTWVNGVASANHDGVNQGTITASWMDGEFCYMCTKVTDELRERIEANRDKVGVSIEAADGVVDENFDIVSARGTGVTFVFPPYEPVCSPTEGCGLAGATTAKESLTEDATSSIPDQGEQMSEDMVPKAELLTLQAAKADVDAQLEALQKEKVELLAFKTKVEEERKSALIDKLKAHLGEDAQNYKDEKPCTLEKMLLAAEAGAKAATKTEFSGASGKKPEDVHVDPDLAAANERLKAAGLPTLE